MNHKKKYIIYNILSLLLTTIMILMLTFKYLKIV